MKSIPHPKVNPYEADRKKPRMSGYDYSRPGIYFVTFCTKDRKCYFGDIVDGQMNYSQQGVIAEVCAKNLPLFYPEIEMLNYVIMPDHIHMLIHLLPQDSLKATDEDDQTDVPTKKRLHSLSNIIGNYKSAVTRHCQRTHFKNEWQGSFYDHIVGNQNETRTYDKYINNNIYDWPYASTHLSPGLMM